MTDAFAALRQALSDRYAIDREIGEGGMATVHLARDLKHDRRVALKVLKPELGAVLGVERFLGEIKVTANLQHPNLLPLFDSGEAEGLLFYVMPFVEGETLRTRLDREKQLPVEDAVRIAAAIASALAYAHEHGVIHRDLKPENILMQAGQPVIADFGIALAVSNAGGARVTQTGLSLGTPQYMSPEQATGDRAIDGRTDIYSLGAMTYEMLVGDPPHTASTAQAIVAKVLTEKPPSVRVARAAVSEEVAYAVERALEKLPADRWSSAAAFADALQQRPGTGTATSARFTRPARVPRWSMRSPLPWAIALAAALVVAAAGWLRTESVQPAPVMRFELQSPPGAQFFTPAGGSSGYLALSPDGQKAVYAVSRQEGGWMFHLRSFDQMAARPLPGTETSYNPQFSPDGQWIAFESGDGTLKKIAVDGSTVTSICKIGTNGTSGLTWTSDRELVFSVTTQGGIRGMRRVPSNGGVPAQFSALDSASGERLQLSPVAADSGRLVFYSSTGGQNSDLTIGVIPTATGRPTLLPGLRGARALGLVAGFLVYVRSDGALMAAPFDKRRLVAGTPIQVGDSIAVHNWDAAAALSASGSLLYQLGGAASQLVSVDITGDRRGEPRVLVEPVRMYVHPRFSPSGERIAFEVQGASGADIWTADLAAKTFERLTREGFNDRPEWTPDGRRVLFGSARTTPQSLWWQPADGSGIATRLQSHPFSIREGVITPDGRALVFRLDTPNDNRDIFMRPLTGDTTPVPLLVGPNDDKQPRVSPDSKWLAYVSNESGLEEVYVRALAPGGGRVPVSAGGAGEPLWSPDGKRLFYRSGAQLIAATIVTAPELKVTARQLLLEGPYASDNYHPNYDIAPDGRSVVMVRPVESARKLVMAVHWVEELRKRSGGSK